MEIITAEQAIEAAKGLTFEKVWAALMENRLQIEKAQKHMDESHQKRMDEYQRRMEEYQRQTDESHKRRMEEYQRRMEESQRQTDESHQKRMDEYQKRMDKSHQKRMDESQKRMDESQRRMDESQRRMEESQRQMEKSVGGLGNTFGLFIEAMFSAKLQDKFNEFGYMFNTQANNKKFFKNKRILAEADSILENGEYAMVVEIKTNLSVDNIEEHLERITIIRQYMDEHGDNRKLVGAVAGGIVPENALRYAQKKGLFVIVQNGDSVEVADMPGGFKAYEW